MKLLVLLMVFYGFSVESAVVNYKKLSFKASEVKILLVTGFNGNVSFQANENSSMIDIRVKKTFEHGKPNSAADEEEKSEQESLWTFSMTKKKGLISHKIQRPS